MHQARGHCWNQICSSQIFNRKGSECMKSSTAKSESDLSGAVLTEQEALSSALRDQATEKPGGKTAPASVPGVFVNKESGIMTRAVLGIFRRLAYWFAVPVILTEYFQAQTGREYGI